MAYHVQDFSIDSEAYVKFLDQVALYTKRHKYIMMVDNLLVHRTDDVKNKSKAIKCELVFNGTYSSEYNPIERLWAWSKARFAKRCVDDGPYHL